MTYQTEFPDFDPATLPPLPEGAEDVSWHNDTCPSFEFPCAALTVYIDYADPAAREFPEALRFSAIVTSNRDLPNLGELVLATDEWSEIQNLIAGSVAHGRAAFSALTREFAAYIDANPELLDQGDAMEMLMGELTPAQRRWISDFVTRWNAAEKLAGFYS